MKLITFLAIAVLSSGVVTLSKQKKQLKSKIVGLEKNYELTFDSLNSIRESNREYIDIAYKCNSEH